MFPSVAAFGHLSPQPNSLQASTKSSEASSVRHFVQSFYDWYTPKALDGDRNEDLDLETLRQRGSMFSPRLRRGLWNAWQAQQMEKGFIVGMDFDPFLNSQDANDRYRVGKIRRKGSQWLVDVNGLPDSEHSYSCRSIAVVEKTNSGWAFTSFIGGPKFDVDLLRVLEQPDSYVTHSSGDSALLRELKNGRRDRALALVRQGAPVNVADKEGNTPLHIAAFRSYADVVDALLASGAKVDAQNKEGESPLFVAMHNCRDPFLEEVSEKIDPQIAAGAAARDPLNIATLLLDHGANPNLPAAGENNYDFKETPLIAASKFGDELAIIELLLKHGADVNAKDSYGDSALNWASWNVHPSVVRILLRRGANVNVQNQSEETALNLAERSTDDAKDPRPAQIIKMLKAAGAVRGKSR